MPQALFYDPLATGYQQMAQTACAPYDWTIIADRSIWLFKAFSPAARDWAEEHIDPTTYRPAADLYPAEPRYAFALASALVIDHAFNIAINGSAVIAPLD